MEAASHNPDIVLLDLGLPDLDGVEVIRRIRSWSNMPIIVISARSEDSDKILGLNIGADDYITKPFSPAEVIYIECFALLKRTLSRGAFYYTEGIAQNVTAVSGCHPYRSCSVPQQFGQLFVRILTAAVIKEIGTSVSVKIAYFSEKLAYARNVPLFCRSYFYAVINHFHHRFMFFDRFFISDTP